MDELTLDGKTYLSSKKAASVTGYAKDYVGQLCREGRVEARLVGRSWYVYEPSIMKHRFNEQGKDDTDVEEVEDKATEAPVEGIDEISEKTNEYEVFEDSTYTPDVAEPIELVEKDESEEKEKVVDAGVNDMQEAWKEWFTYGTQTNNSVDSEKVSAEVEEEEVETVPIHIVEEEKKPIQSMDIENIVPETPKIAHRETESYKVSEYRAPKRSSNLVARALIIAVAVVVVSVAVIGTGGADTVLVDKGDELGILRFIAGRTDI